MNSDTAFQISRPQSLSDPNFNLTFCAAFFGFILSAILFGITVRQTYEYYMYAMKRDSITRRLIIGTVCILDTLNLAFGMRLLYSYVRALLGDTGASWHVVWSLKALATTQVFLVLLVHAFYLTQMWIFTRCSILLAERYTVAARIFVIVISIFTVAVAVIFLSYLPRIDVVYGFSPGLEYILYLGLGTTAFVDCSIAGAMCVILYKCSTGLSTGVARTESVVESLIQYFVGTGLLTSFAAIMVIVLYVARQQTLLYLLVEFSVTRLYANAILAMFNARHSLSERIGDNVEAYMPPEFRKEPESSGSRFGWQGNITSPISATRYSPAGESRKTPGGSSQRNDESGHLKVSHETGRYTV